MKAYKSLDGYNQVMEAWTLDMSIDNKSVIKLGKGKTSRLSI